MLYWIIPYLVAYNARSSSNWEYGPQHVFRAAVRSTKVNYETNFRADWDMYIDFVCRPMFLSSIQCRIESTMLVMGVALANGSSWEPVNVTEKLCLDRTLFEIEYDEEGISTVSFLNNFQPRVHNLIRAMVDGMNLGIDIADKEAGKYVSQEKSSIGICNTIFTIEYKPPWNDGPRQFGEFEFLLGPQQTNIKIVITKQRQSQCINETSHFIGPYEEVDAGTNLKPRNRNGISLSSFDLSNKSFRTVTKNFGILVEKAGDESGQEIEVYVYEQIDVTLKAIERATEDHWDAINSVNPTSC